VAEYAGAQRPEELLCITDFCRTPAEAGVIELLWQRGLWRMITWNWSKEILLG